jgi:extracellular elastinolytic metalloproteinase
MRRFLPASGRSRTVIALTGLLAMVAPVTLVASPPSAHRDTHMAHEAHSSMPANYDYRNDLLAQRAGKVRENPKQRAAADRLKAQVAGLKVDLDEVSALPKQISALAPGSRLSKAGPSDAAAAARAFLRANRELYSVDGADLASLDVIYTTAPKAGDPGAAITRFQQTIDNVPVFGAEVAVVMSPKNHAVVGTSGIVYPGIIDAARSKTRALSMGDALARASKDLTSIDFKASDFVAGSLDGAGMTRFAYAPDRGASAPFFGEGLRVQSVYFPVAAGEVIAGYYVEVLTQGEPAGSGPCFSLVISAEDGRVLFRNNLVSDDSYQYRVFGDNDSTIRPFDSSQGTAGQPHPTSLADQFQASEVGTNDLTIEGLLGPTDPWLAPSATATNGNNVDSYLDIAGSDGFGTGDIRGATSGPGQFLYSYDPTTSTTDATIRQVKTTHMFYYNNYLHDVWYQRGFNEVARNAQTSNYGRGGAENDNIRGEGEDRSGTNNANMLTPADGGRPRMQMFRFTGSGDLGCTGCPPQRDSSIDWGIVAHEWGHYISHRLVNNSNGLNNNQGSSMSEGWGDYNGLITSVRVGDDLDGAYSVGAWACFKFWNTSFLDNYLFGIRRYPFSSRPDRSPLTFKDIGPGLSFPAGVPRSTSVGGSAAEVHNSGEVWANMLWEVSVALMKTYGVEDGRTRAMQYVCDGMKNTPASPTFGQARDGVVTAANASDPTDVPIVWQAFAERGHGEGSVSPASGSFNHSGITESFVAPLALPNDTIGFATGGTFFERNVHKGGNADMVVPFGSTGQYPIVGNWDGGSTVGPISAQTVGTYVPTTGAWFLKFTNAGGPADLAFFFGAANPAHIPVTGDWDGDGVDTIGFFDPATAAFFLRNSNTPGPADVIVIFGVPATGLLPVVGDWNGDGTDTIGVYNPATTTFFLKDANTPGAATYAFGFGAAGLQPIAGDWNSDGADSIGVYDQSTSTFYLRNTLTPGFADLTINFGAAGVQRPIAGNFDGQ